MKEGVFRRFIQDWFAYVGTQMENPNPKIHAVAPRTSVVLDDFETGLNVDYVFGTNL